MEQNSEIQSIPSNSKQIVDLGLNQNIKMSPNYTTDVYIKEELVDINNIPLSELKCEPDWEDFQTESDLDTTFIKVEPDISKMINNAEECEPMENLNEALYMEWKVKNEDIKIGIEDNEDSMESSLLYHEDGNIENCTTDENPETSNTNRYRCQLCNFETMYKGNLKLHSFKHKIKADLDKFKCNQCPYKTVYKRNINRHLLKHTSLKDIIRYKCDHCSYMTIYKRSLSLHSNDKHKDLGKNSKLKCNQCNYKTTLQKNLERHILKHADPEEVDMYQCDKCKFKTLYKRNLVSHSLKHRNPLEGCRFKCTLCDFQTNYKSNLNKHVQKHQEVVDVQEYKNVLDSKVLKPEPQ